MGKEGAGIILENDAANSCFGCGTNNPRGLHLSFCQAGDRVETKLIASATMEGWPGRLHSGILYIAMLEAANWTVYGLTKRIGVPTRTSALDVRRWVSTGTHLRVAGRVTHSTPGQLSVVVEAWDSTGELVASLNRDFVLPSRHDFLERMGYEEIPEVFAGLIPD